MKNPVKKIKMFLGIAGMLVLLSCNTSAEESEKILPALSVQEESDLLHLREEEKLARDVYIYAYEKYGVSISNNISLSEQTHMDRVLQILSEYGLEDNASALTGVFNNAELQELYDQLVAKVDVSLLDALIVGATIEDLDIKDIDDFMQRTTNPDMLAMYENLKCGSRNHLRSYYSQILAYGGSYSPAYISQADFDEIVSSDKERCGLN